MQQTNEELVESINAGGDRQQLMLELWLQNQGLLRMCVKKYSSYAEYDDLMQTAYLGLDAAVRHYDASKGAAFSTVLCHWVKQELGRYLENHRTAVRIPSYMRQRILAYKRAKTVLASRLGRKPYPIEIRWYLSITPEELEEVKAAAELETVLSADKPIPQDDGDEGTLLNIIPDHRDDMAEAEERIYQEELAHDLWGAVDTLPGRQGAVLRARYQEGVTFAELAGRYGVTGNAIRQTERQALRTLGHGKQTGKIYPYYENICARSMHGTGFTSFARTFTSATEREAIRLIEQDAVRTARQAQQQIFGGSGRNV